jgi:amino acid adenylation domain-containing protein
MDNCAPATTARLEQMFECQAAATPEAPAIVYRGCITTYGELAERVAGLHRDLLTYAVAPGVLVGVCLQRTPDLIAVLLAILKAGGAYLPLDPRYPAERMAFILADSGATLLIADCDSPAWRRFDGGALGLADGALAHRSGLRAARPTAPADLAYVIYTSGSTGRPKGVMLGHGATHLVEWARRAYSDHERSRIAATTSVCFDPSIFEIFTPLCTGGALILKQDALEPFSADEAPTMLDTVPSVLVELCRTRAIPPSVRVLNVGGEPLTSELAQSVHDARPHLALYNHYGPTEATTCATVAKVPRDLLGEPSIGLPVRGAQIRLLDPAGAPVAPGEAGEIYIGGPGLALGYLNRPELTARSFVQGPDGQRLYRTGDLGRWAGGELRFAGRVDRQVKIRGYRVELGEVESALLRLPDVEMAVAVLRPVGDRSQLVAYVQSQQPLTPAAVREALRAWLPDYMVPARIQVMRRLPLLVSGKVDHSALPPLEGPTEELEDAPVGLMEKPIIHVFKEVLGRTSVGPTDSFFDLGGDSLSSVHAAMRLEDVLGYEVPAALIHQAPTPRLLARSLQHALVRVTGHVSLLNRGGPGTPLFCMADLFGHAFNYLSLAARLGADRPVYGVVPGPLQEAFAEDGDIGRLARSFTTQLRLIQPQGPYLIAGYSAGGLLAVEVARQLERQNQAVTLILLDSHLHSGQPAHQALVHWGLQRWRALPGPHRPAAIARRAMALGGKLARQFTPGAEAPPDWVPRSQVAFAASMIRAALRYRPGPFGGPTLIVEATKAEAAEPSPQVDGRLGWAKVLTGDVTQVSVAGGHHQFLREPLVAETAMALDAFLAALPSRVNRAKPLVEVHAVHPVAGVARAAGRR